MIVCYGCGHDRIVGMCEDEFGLIKFYCKVCLDKKKED